MAETDRCGAWIIASLVIALLFSYVSSADPNVEEVEDIDGFKLTCPSTVPTSGAAVSWKGPDGSQLNFENRTFSDMRFRFVNDRDLEIMNAVPSDNGLYTCFQGNVEATVNLTVYVTSVPKLQMTFQDEYFDETTGRYQLQTDYNVSQEVTCYIRGAFPKPSIFFMFQNANDSLSTMIPESSLIVSSMLESDNTYSVNITTTIEVGDSITFNNRRVDCFAMFPEANNRTAVRSVFFYIRNVKPTLFVYGGLATVTPSKPTLELTGTSIGSRERVDSVVFYIDGEVIAEPYSFTQSPVMCHTIDSLGDKYRFYQYKLYECNSTLTLNNVTKMDNGKMIDCEIIYQNMTVSRLGDRALDVRFPPTMVNITGTTAVEVSGFNSATIQLTCSTDSSNGNSTISWYNGTNMIASTANETNSAGMYNGVITSEVLTLSVDRYMDGNMIQCQANHVYLPFTPPFYIDSTVTLNVSYSPEIIQPTSSIYRAYSDEQLMIPCSAVAKPAAALKWWHVYSPTNKTEVTSPLFRMSSNGNAFLEFKPVTTMHSGTYECKGMNGILPDVSKSVDVIVLDKSSLAPYDVVKLTPASNSIDLEFRLPTDRQIQRLFLRYTTLDMSGNPVFPRETELVIPDNENVVSIRVVDLQPSTQYELSLREVDATYGISATTFLRSIYTPAADDSDTYSRKDLNIAIIVSVLVTAAVVTIICVIVFVLIRNGCSSASTKYDMQMKPRA